MTRCRSEGELRAFLDRELPAVEAERVSAHVAECGACGASVEALRTRAERVAELLDELQQGGPARLPSRRVAHAWAVVAAVAACLAVAFILAFGRTAGPRPVAPRKNVTASNAAANTGPAQLAAAVAPRESAVPAPQTASRARSVSRKKAPSSRPDVKYFLALDDEPLEVGMVMRVALGPAEVPADVVFSPDGRARAIRLVSDLGTRGGR